MREKKRFFPAASILGLAALASCTHDGRYLVDEKESTATEAVCYAPPVDEFFPFLASPSWTTLNVVSGTDITAALQAAVTSLTSTAAAGGSDVLYIPAGNYTLSSTVVLRNAFGVTIVGDDPATTVITWAGPSNTDMFRFVDSSYSKFSRLTLDGGSTARIAVQIVQSACYAADYSGPSPCTTNADCGLLPGTTCVADASAPVPYTGYCGATCASDAACSGDPYGGVCLGNHCKPTCHLPVPPTRGWATYFLEFNDDVFQNAEYGIVAGEGTYVGNYVPTSLAAAGGINTVTSNIGNCVVRRSAFRDIGEQGLVLSSWNALDWVIADSEFSTSTRGIQANQGTIVAINNLFSANTEIDVNLLASSQQIVRGNKSIGSNQFLQVGGGAGTFQVDVSGNYITTAAGSPYAILDSGSHMMLFDNYISVPAGSFGIATTGTPAYVTHGGNSFVGPAASLLHPLWGSYTEVDAGGDSSGATPPVPAAAASAQSNAAVPSPPFKQIVTPTNVAVTFPQCSSPTTLTCASGINGWLASVPTTTSAVLYFPAGNYYLDAPIEVPAYLKATVTGDGLRSQVNWIGVAGTNPDPYMVHFNGPVQGSIRDLYLVASAMGTSRVGGVLIDSADTVGNRVFLDTVVASYAKSVIDVVGLDNTLVRADQSGGGAVERMVGVIGGGAGSTSSNNTRGVVMFGGGGASLSSYAEIKGWGKAVFIGADNEGSTQGLTLDQAGYVTFDGGRMVTGPVPAEFAPYFSLQPNIVVQSTFRGRAAFVNLDDYAGILSTGSTQGEILSLNNWYVPPQPGSTIGQPAAVVCPTTACPFSQQNPTALAANKQMALQDGSTCSTGFPNFYYCADQAGAGATSAIKGAFVSSMLGDLRNTSNALGASSCTPLVRVHRLFFQGITVGGPANFARAAVRVQRL